MTEFEVVLRGYDRLAVDHLVQAVEAAAGDRTRISAAIDGAGQLPTVLRGYAPAQVDAWLAQQLGGEPAAPIVWEVELSVVLRGYRPAETDALLATVHGALESGDAARRAAAAQAVAQARLPVAFRGYDRAQVDAYLRQVVRELRSP